MNEHVRDALEDAVHKLDARIKWASEALQEAKRQAHGRDQELAELYHSRKAIKDYLGSQDDDDDEVDLDSAPGVPGGTAWDINTPTYPVSWKLVVPSLSEEHRDREWVDSYGCSWRWHGYEDGKWQYRFGPDDQWKSNDRGPYSGPFTQWVK